MKNILYVSHTAELRGSAMSIRELMLNVDRSRFRPFAVVSKEGPLIADLQGAGIETLRLVRRGLFNLARIHAAYRLMKARSIDLVHLNSAVPFCRDIGIAARCAGLPVIWHIREDPEGKRVRRLAKWIRSLAGKIVVVSQDQQKFFASSGKSIKVYNGINLDRFTPQGDDGGWRARLGIAADEFVFILCGTIEERKGQHLVVEAAAQLVGERRFRLLIVGSALTAEDQRRLDGALEKYPSIRQITVLTGKQTDVAGLMRAADCMVMASSWEGFPRSLAEGMATGLPVIATDVGETAAMVGPEQGWLLPGPDPSLLARAMQQALEAGPDDPRGNNALQRAQDWSIGAHVGRMQTLYDELLN